MGIGLQKADLATTTGEELHDADALPRPKTFTVLALLVMAALVLSYLAAYALADALLAAEFLPQWPDGADPRPRWMLTAFGALLGGFLLLGAAFRFLSRRQLRRIDAIAEEG